MHPKLTDDIPVGEVHKIYDIVCSEMKGRWGGGGGGLASSSQQQQII